MLNPNSLKAKPADNYDDLKKQFFALKNLCESKIKQCSIYSNKLAEYDRESILARSKALESEKEMNAQLTEELAKANERVEELERFQEEVAYKCFTAGLNTEKPKGPSGKNQTATEINHFEVMVDRYVIGTSRSILEQLRKEQGDDK